MRLNKWTYLVCCFAILVTISLTSNVGALKVQSFAPADRFLEGVNGLNDAVSFFDLALDLYRTGHVSPANAWLINLWPPGFVALEAAILKVFGTRAPFIFILQITASLAFACMLTLERAVLRRYVCEAFACILPLLIFLMPVARWFLLEPTGVVFGETFAVAAFFSACFLVMLAVERNNLKLATAAGICFALSAYFRSQYELIVLALTGVGVIALFFAIAIRRFSKQSGMASCHRTTIKVIFVALFCAHVAMIPWRMRNYLAGFGPTWVQTSGLIIQNSLSTEKDLLARGGAFVISGAGNLACRFEPTYCGHYESRLFYKAFLKHLPEWYRVRLDVISNYWQPYPIADWSTATAWRVRENLSNDVFLVCLLAILPLLWFSRASPAWLALTWLTVSFYGAFFVIFSLVHFEPRYFYLVKFFSFIGFIHLALAARSSWRRKRDAKDDASSSPLSAFAKESQFRRHSGR
jgi:hypothetical protein